MSKAILINNNPVSISGVPKQDPTTGKCFVPVGSGGWSQTFGSIDEMKAMFRAADETKAAELRAVPIDAALYNDAPVVAAPQAPVQ